MAALSFLQRLKALADRVGAGAPKDGKIALADPVANLIAAAVNQIVASKTDAAHELSREANANLFTAKDAGLLYGPYSPRYHQDP